MHLRAPSLSTLLLLLTTLPPATLSFTFQAFDHPFCLNYGAHGRLLSSHINDSSITLQEWQKDNTHCYKTVDRGAFINDWEFYENIDKIEMVQYSEEGCRGMEKKGNWGERGICFEVEKGGGNEWGSALVVPWPKVGSLVDY